ncbi:hypothetical protein O9K51_04388 [Purpureocillium lavendulum]|uniref:Uncharacterized protein n=1 Tax=Purpureocillium lavendulum TaxID=1247861 RepID=A0AB34FWF3_9HYPO|nr:hypothetical protein O9K51_04388 [Purpureocillium lavendulum]
MAQTATARLKWVQPGLRAHLCGLYRAATVEDCGTELYCAFIDNPTQFGHDSRFRSTRKCRNAYEEKPKGAWIEGTNPDHCGQRGRIDLILHLCGTARYCELIDAGRNPDTFFRSSRECFGAFERRRADEDSGRRLS